MKTLEEYRENFSILIVDDNEDNCYTLERRLKRENLKNVDIVHDGLEVMEILKKKNFDLILLDIMMPNMDGFQVLEKLRDEIMARRIMVITISADDKMDSILKCIELGADDFLAKPFNASLLRVRINSCVERKWYYSQQDKIRDELSSQKQQYERLLYSVFPLAVVDELSRTGAVEPRSYENVAVLFADIVGFTKYSDIHTPKEVHSYLQQLLDVFETSAMRFNVEKIKTIGDAFLATAGMLQPSSNPVLEAVKCAEDIIKNCKVLSSNWQIRIGINFGDVVAGIVGHRRYLFDIWGDTVNTASRVQTIAEPNTIYLTQLAFEQVKDLIETIDKGKQELKGKGEMNIYQFDKIK